MPDEIGLFEAMYTQRSLRRLKPDDVPDNLVLKLIEAATKAPSGGNRQPWAFITIREPATKQKLAEWYLDAWSKTYGQIPAEQRQAMAPNMKRVVNSAEHLAHHFVEVPVCVLVCAKDAPPPGGFASASFYASIYPAVQNLLLAARGLGLAATLTTFHKMHEEEVKALLGIPDTVETVALIPIGYPTGKYGPTARRPLDEVVHSERWDPAKP